MPAQEVILSIIVVSFNTSRLLKNCLESVVKALQSDGYFKNSEVIIVDNKSVDDSVRMVRKLFPQMVVIENDTNAGFAGGNNIGIRASKGKYILLLNSDTIIKKGLFRQLISTLEDNQEIGVAGPKLLNPDGSLQPSNGGLPDLFRVFLWMTFLDDLPWVGKVIEPYHNQERACYQKSHEVGWLSGACFMFNRKILAECGFLDEKIFMYGEEVEWCHRIRQFGYKIYYLHAASVIHLKGASGRGRTSGTLEEFTFIRYYYQLHKPGIQKAFAGLILRFGALLRIVLFGIIRPDQDKKNIYVEALYAA